MNFANAHPGRAAALLALTLSLWGPQAAHAALTCSGTGLTGTGAWTCSETQSLTVSQTVLFDLWTPSAANGFALTGFTPSLAKVEWSANASFAYSGRAFNDTEFRTDITVAATDSMSWTPTAGAPVSLLPNPISAEQSVIVGSRANALPGSSLGLQKTFTLGPVFGSTANPAGWVGEGSFGESLDLQATVFPNSDIDQISVSPSASLTIIYSGITAVSAVPEAPRGALLAAGILALGLVARRQQLRT
jgi:hypothetical protein